MMSAVVRPAWQKGDKTGGCIVTVVKDARDEAGIKIGDTVMFTCLKPGQLLLTKLDIPNALEQHKLLKLKHAAQKEEE